MTNDCVSSRFRLGFVSLRGFRMTIMSIIAATRHSSDPYVAVDIEKSHTGNLKVPSTRSRKQRQAISCIECRLRKTKCDHVVPGCSACVRRGRTDKCRWGDERDSLSLVTNSESLAIVEHRSANTSLSPRVTPPPTTSDTNDGVNSSFTGLATDQVRLFSCCSHGFLILILPA